MRKIEVIENLHKDKKLLTVAILLAVSAIISFTEMIVYAYNFSSYYALPFSKIIFDEYYLSFLIESIVYIVLLYMNVEYKKIKKRKIFIIAFIIEITVLLLRGFYGITPDKIIKVLTCILLVYAYFRKIKTVKIIQWMQVIGFACFLIVIFANGAGIIHQIENIIKEVSWYMSVFIAIPKILQYYGKTRNISAEVAEMLLLELKESYSAKALSTQDYEMKRKEIIEKL